MNYKCGASNDSRVFDHDHTSREAWRQCGHPEYRGMDSALADKPKAPKVKTNEYKGQMYLGAPSNYDVAKYDGDDEERIADVKQIASAETEAQKAERKRIEAGRRDEARNAERESYVRQLKAQKAPLKTELAGLRADRRTARNGWYPIGLGGAVSIGLLGAAALVSIFGDTFAALTVIGFILGGLGLLGTVAFVFYWMERFYSGSNVAAEIAKREEKVSQIDNELQGYADIQPDALVM